MILRHASPGRNRLSISQEGICTRYATGKIKGVWLHPAGKSWWALEHVARRHGAAVAACDLYFVDVSKALSEGTLKKGPHGTYYLTRDVDPGEITRVVTSKEHLLQGEGDDDNGRAA